MKSSHFRSTLQQFLTRSRVLPSQPGRPSGKVMRISDLPEFRPAGQILASEPALALPVLQEHGQRVCQRIVQQESIPARDFYGIPLQEAHVFGPSVMVATGQGSVICEISKEWGVYLKHPEASWIQRRFFLPKPRYLPGKTFLLASTGAETFYHWMLESLPRLALWKMAGGSPGEVDHWLVSRKSPSFVRESLTHLGIPWEKVLDFSENQHWVCEALELSSLASDWGMPSALAVNFLRKAFPENAGSAGRRFYLRRGETKDRRVRDEEDLVVLLEKKGYQTLDPRRLGVRETATALSRAECIVAPHGAALTNMVFSPPGCRVVEIFNPAFTNPCYRMLAARCGQPYTAVYGQATQARSNHPADASGDIVMEPPRLLQVLDAAGSAFT